LDVDSPSVSSWCMTSHILDPPTAGVAFICNLLFMQGETVTRACIFVGTNESEGARNNKANNVDAKIILSIVELGVGCGCGLRDGQALLACPPFMYVYQQ
jgi:hypothetical protein